MILAGQRLQRGLCPKTIARNLGYSNMSHITKFESGQSKIPVNKVDRLVSAYQLDPEFALVILLSEYPDFLGTILRYTQSVPHIFSEGITDPAEEIMSIYTRNRDGLGLYAQ